jgi:cytochrome P450
MVLHPDVQRKARGDIAAVVTPGTLPAFDDEPSLPYISAIVLEVLRWRPVTPIGMQSEYSLDMID